MTSVFLAQKRQPSPIKTSSLTPAIALTRVMSMFMLLMLIAGHNNEFIWKLLCILGSIDDQLLHSDFYNKRQLITVYFH